MSTNHETATAQPNTKIRAYACHNCGCTIKEEWINKGTPGADCGSCPHYKPSVEFIKEMTAKSWENR